MPTSLIIVDDFLESPDLLREVALKQEYPVPEIPAVYPGRNSKYNQLINGYDQRISQLAGEPLKPVSGDGVFGKFRLATGGRQGHKGRPCRQRTVDRHSLFDSPRRLSGWHTFLPTYSIWHRQSAPDPGRVQSNGMQ